MKENSHETPTIRFSRIFFSPQENRKIWIICKCIIIGGLCQASSISMTIAGYDFFSCFRFACFAWFMELLFFNCIISSTFSVTCSLVASFIDGQLHEKAIFPLSVTARSSHHQCLTYLWPWSSVSSHTLNAGCLGSHWRLSIAFGLLCLLGS